MISTLLFALWVGPAYSGSWYSPERNGEGFTLQVLDNGTAHALWFTYPPAGSEAQQAWIYASGGRIDGDRIRFEGAFTTRGPRFGAQFDPARLQIIPWGTLEFRFTYCNEAEMTYAGPVAWGSGSRRVTRLTALSELECIGKRHVGGSGARINIADNLRPVGTRFGTSFDAAQVRNTSWGRLDLELSGRAQGTLRYESSLTAFGSGTLRPIRLTTPAGTTCIEGTPTAPVSGSWSTAAPEPNPVSEAAIASVDGVAYLAGGFGDTQGFKRYDADRDQWTVLAPTPAGRDHGLAAAIDGSIYVTGGNHNGGGDHSSAGWRYVIAENRWEAIAQLPHVTQAGAAALDGFAWFSDTQGNLVQFDPRTRATRNIQGDGRAPRDHSQLVAFQGELWMIGGRIVGDRETARVSIFDPASETWRPGPQLLTARAGFAVAATPTRIIVAGGEVLSGVWRTLSSVEGFGAGQLQWSGLPALPTALHGFGGMIRGNAFHTLGGTTIPGGIANAGIVQVLRW